MVRVLISVFLLWLAFLGMSGCAESADAEVFRNLSFDDAVSQAKQESKIVLVDYTASWCGPCKKMERDTWPNADVEAWVKEHAVAIQVDVDEDRALAGRHGINAMPTMIAFRDGEEVARHVGYLDASGLLEWLKENVG